MNHKNFQWINFPETFLFEVAHSMLHAHVKIIESRIPAKLKILSQNRGGKPRVIFAARGIN